MKKLFSALTLIVSAGIIVVVVVRAADHSRVIQLPTSKTLTVPVPGFIGRTNSFPATIAVSPNGRYAALLNQGYGTLEAGGRQSIAILNLSNNQLRDFPDERLVNGAHQSYFIGLAFSSDGSHLYTSMGSITDPTGENPKNTGNGIAVYKFADGQVTPERFIKIPLQRVAEGKEVAFGLRKTPAGTVAPYPAGFAVLHSEKGDRLLVANNLADNVVLLDVASGEILKSFDLSHNRYMPASYPYTVIANKAGTRAWVSLWNESSIAELNVETGAVHRIQVQPPRSEPIAPSSHPTEMVLNAKEDILYVATANTEFVVAVDLQNGVALRRYLVNLTNVDPSNLGNPSNQGVVPQAIALSPDGKRLYVASGSLDAVAVFEVKTVPNPTKNSILQGPVEDPVGFIPTEWYPSALAAVGNDLLIATAKGEGSGPNNMKVPIQIGPYRRAQAYIATLIGGSIQRLSFTDIDKNLVAYTRQVEENNLLRADTGKIEFAGGKNPIRHVIYVLRENRTYDQIFGDLSFGGQPIGDGDSSLTMYGADITPNAHKLALQFGVLDNFYDSGEVSGDGHLWSTAATSSDYNEKIWPINYRSKERTYDFGGAVADDLMLEKGIPDIDDPGTGFLWDDLEKSHMSYRIYGEFVEAVWCRRDETQPSTPGTPSAAASVCSPAEIKKGDPLPDNVGNPRGGPSPWPWTFPLFKEVRAGKAALRGHYDPKFPDFNTEYPDQLRADEFLREFDEFVKARGTAKELPQFTLLYLPDDHTGGTRPGKPTPKASVADNDLALGRVVDAVSHSPYWDDTAVFVLEDDAQNGADHVDAHRSVALVISKYSPRSEKAFVDHHFYTTVSMVHTVENLLSLPPMNLFDAHAPLMAPLFSGPGTQPAYSVDDKNLQNGLVYQVNAKMAEGAKESLKMDFSRPDAADAEKLNAILWRDAKGNTPLPVLRNSHSDHQNSEP